MYLKGIGPTEIGRRYGLTKRVVLDTLKHRIHIGEIPYGGKVFQGKHKPLVSRADWSLVRERMPDIPRGPRPTQQKYPYILSGLIHCDCGRAMTPATSTGRSRKYHYYRCTDNVDCKGRVSAPQVESMILDALREFTLDTELLEATYLEIQAQWRESVMKTMPPPGELQTAIQAAKRKKERIMDIFESGVVNKDNAAEWNERLTRARRRLDTLLEQREAAQAALGPDADILEAARRWLATFRDIGAVAHASDPEAQRDLCRTMISDIKKLGDTWHVYLNTPGAPKGIEWQPVGDLDAPRICLVVSVDGWSIAA
jgi:hypothetical protein